MENITTRRSFIIVSDITDTIEDNVRARYKMARIFRKEVIPRGRGVKKKSGRLKSRCA